MNIAKGGTLPSKKPNKHRMGYDEKLNRKPTRPPVEKSSKQWVQVLNGREKLRVLLSRAGIRWNS